MINADATLNGAKTIVRSKYPTAYAKEGLMSGNWYIYRAKDSQHILASAVTARQAWKIAAGRL